jgi:hypothetical protein
VECRSTELKGEEAIKYIHLLSSPDPVYNFFGGYDNCSDYNSEAVVNLRSADSPEDCVLME